MRSVGVLGCGRLRTARRRLAGALAPSRRPRTRPGEIDTPRPNRAPARPHLPTHTRTHRTRRTTPLHGTLLPSHALIFKVFSLLPFGPRSLTLAKSAKPRGHVTYFITKKSSRLFIFQLYNFLCFISNRRSIKFKPLLFKVYSN